MRRKAMQSVRGAIGAFASGLAAVAMMSAGAIAAPTSTSPGALRLLRDLSGRPAIDRPLVMAEPLTLSGVQRDYWIVEPADGQSVLTAPLLELTLGEGMPLAMVVISEVLARVHEGVDPAAFRQTLQQQYGVDPAAVEELPRLPGVFRIGTEGALAAMTLSNALAQAPNVRWAHPNGWMPAASTGGAGGITVTIDDGDTVTEVDAETPFDFGSVASDADAPVTVIVENNEATPTQVTLLGVPTGFIATPPDFNATINAGETASFTLTLDGADTAALRGGQVSLGTNIVGEDDFLFTVYGTVFAGDDAVAPNFVLSYFTQAQGFVVIPSNNQPAFDFGATGIGVPLSREFLIQNIGGRASNASVQLGSTTVNFSLMGATAPVLQPGDRSSLTLTFDAMEALGLGNFGASLIITVPGPGSRSYNFAGQVIETPPQEEVDDPLFANQWHLFNDGSIEGTRPGVDVRIFGAWDLTLGGAETPANRAIVAVMDDGSQPNHPDYATNVLPCAGCVNFFNASFADGNRAFPNDQQGAHGTSVAGLIGALPNEIGGRGTAPEAGLILTSFVKGELNYADPDPATNGQMTFDEQADNILAAAEAGAQVHSNSWGFISIMEPPDIIADAYDTIATEGRDGKGVLVLFASGNSFIPVPYGNVLAASENVLAVGAANSKGFRSSYSNFGPWLDIVAPSNDPFDALPPAALGITTTDVTGVTGYNSNPSEAGGDYANDFGGTSAATPIAAGAASLMFALNPNLTAQQAMRILRATARPSPLLIGQGRPFVYPIAQSDSLGFGIIDATAAAQAALAALTNGGQTYPAPARNVQLTRFSGGQVQLDWENPPFGVEGEFDHVLVVRHTSGWRPIDGVEYEGGQAPASGVTILAKGDETLVTYTDLLANNLSNTRYSVYIVNGILNYSDPVTFRAYPREPITVFQDDFDGPDTGWIATGDWERGAPTFTFGPYIQLNSAASPPNVYATNLDDFVTEFDDQGQLVTHVLVSPPISFDLNTNVTSGSVSWDQKLDVVGDGFDTLLVEVIDGAAQNPLSVPPLRALSVNNILAYDSYAPMWFNLNSEAIGRRTIRLRFTYVSPLGLGGWLIDNFRVAASTNGQGPDFGEGRPRRIDVPINGVIVVFNGPIAIGYNGDVTGDGVVTTADLAALLQSYGLSSGSDGFRPAADSDGDGVIGFRDLMNMMKILSHVPPPPAGGITP